MGGGEERREAHVESEKLEIERGGGRVIFTISQVKTGKMTSKQDGENLVIPHGIPIVLHENKCVS